MQGYCFASLAMTSLKTTKEKERDRCNRKTDDKQSMMILQRFRSFLLRHLLVVIARSGATKQPVK